MVTLPPPKRQSTTEFVQIRLKGLSAPLLVPVFKEGTPPQREPSTVISQNRAGRAGNAAAGRVQAPAQYPAQVPAQAPAAPKPVNTAPYPWMSELLEGYYGSNNIAPKAPSAPTPVLPKHSPLDTYSFMKTRAEELKNFDVGSRYIEAGEDVNALIPPALASGNLRTINLAWDLQARLNKGLPIPPHHIGELTFATDPVYANFLAYQQPGWYRNRTPAVDAGAGAGYNGNIIHKNAGESQGFGLGDAAGLGKFATDATRLQARRFELVTPRKTPLPGSQYVVPGTVKVNTSSIIKGKGMSSADDIFKFRINNGKIEITGKNHLLENGGLNKVQKAYIEALDQAKIPKPVAKVLQNSDDLARASKLVKNGGTALGWIGTAFDAYELVNVAYEDLQDEDKIPGKKTLKAGAAFVGSWGGGVAGAKLGAMGGAAIGSLICPVLGTAIGGFIGGVVGGWVGSEAGSALLEHVANEAYHGE